MEVVQDSAQTPKPKSEDEKKADEKILATARERFDRAAEAETEIRAVALEDLKFSIGDQWPTKVKQSRHADNRPCLTINRLPQFIHQVTNDQRQNRPSMKVSPVDDEATPDIAKIYQGLIRHIEYSSNADTAYDIAFDSAVRAGFGYFRLMTDYCDSRSFDQDIIVRSIPERFSVYLDPNYQEPDGSDAGWGFVFDTVAAEDFKNQFPNAELGSMQDWSGLGDTMPGWIEKDTVRIAEYYTKEFRETELLLLSNGDVFEAGQVEEEKLPGNLKIVDRRRALAVSVKWYKINGLEILDRADVPGEYVPIIPVLGERIVIEGKKTLEGVVRHSKDAQRMYNYWTSSETETIALAPRAPFIGAEGQFEGHEGEWETANVRNHAYLQYKPTTIGGIPAPPPQRNIYEPPVQAITGAKMVASDDMKATTGIYDAAIGAQSNENSGIAIQRRNNQSQTSNFHFVDNLRRSMRHAGRIIVSWIPTFYDSARSVRILHEDNTEEVIKINQEFDHKGKRVNYQMDRGKYDVTINTGPSFETRRQEAVQSQLELMKSMPQLGQIAGDIITKNMDWAGSDKISERLKKTLPPGIADDDQQHQPIPPQIQQKIQSYEAMIDQLTQQLSHKTQQINTKAIELESRERIEFAKMELEASVELARLQSQEASSLLTQEVAGIRHRLELLQASQPIPGTEESDDTSGPNQGAAQASPQEQQPPTGGPTPGQSMGGNQP